MTMNNPFIRYKKYSTPVDHSDGKSPLLDNVKVLCLISLEETEKQPFLKKILSAAKISENDYQILPISEQITISAADQKWFDQLEYILCFGLPASIVDINIPYNSYRSTEIRNTKVIQLPGLQKIEMDKNEKQNLWRLLKNEFLNE